MPNRLWNTSEVIKPQAHNGDDLGFITVMQNGAVKKAHFSTVATNANITHWIGAAELDNHLCGLLLMQKGKNYPEAEAIDDSIKKRFGLATAVITFRGKDYPIRELKLPVIGMPVKLGPETLARDIFLGDPKDQKFSSKEAEAFHDSMDFQAYVTDEAIIEAPDRVLGALMLKEVMGGHVCDRHQSQGLEDLAGILALTQVLRGMKRRK